MIQTHSMQLQPQHVQLYLPYIQSQLYRNHRSGCHPSLNFHFVKKRRNGTNIFAIGHYSSTKLNTRIGTQFPFEEWSVHFLALGTVVDAYPQEIDSTHHICGGLKLWWSTKLQFFYQNNLPKCGAACTGGSIAIMASSIAPNRTGTHFILRLMFSDRNYNSGGNFVSYCSRW